MSDKPKIDVRQARIDDLPAIQDFIQQCYGAEAPFKAEARWRWQYTASPYEPSKDGEAMVWIALNGDEVVGQMGSQPGRLLLDGRPLPVGWNLDLMVRPDHRGLGLAHKIHGAMAATGRTLTTLTMAPASRIVFVRAGALTLPPVYEMVRPGRLGGATLARAIAERTQTRGRAVRTAGRLFNATWIAPRLLAASLSAAAAVARRRPATDAAVTLGFPERPDPEEAQALFERFAEGQEALFDRGRDFVTWRLGQPPDVRYEFAEARREGVLTGLAAWRGPHPVEYPLGVLADVWTAPGDAGAADALVEAAVSALAPQSEAVVAGASHPDDVALLKRHGFWPTKTHHPTLMTIDPVLKAQVEKPRVWRFTKADSDFDQVYPAPS